MKSLKCIDCGQDRALGMRRCRPCYLIAKRKHAKKRYEKFGRHAYHVTCKACNNIFDSGQKTTTFCPSCRANKRKNLSNNNYVYVYDKVLKQGKHEHREIVKRVLNRNLSYNEVVHHLDFDTRNNELTNLIVLSRKIHGKLHLYLDTQRVIIEKSMNENFENCWKNLIVPMTTAWLEITNANVIKIWEIGQSAAEHLTPKGNDEGSETMHETSKPEMVDEDIVQTTTVMVSEN
jgi:hypothetical protein